MDSDNRSNRFHPGVVDASCIGPAFSELHGRTSEYHSIYNLNHMKMITSLILFVTSSYSLYLQKCMNDVFKIYKPQGGILSCTAKEVYANNATVIDGPDECIRGQNITVNLTASIHFNTDRKDPAIYISQSNVCTETANGKCASSGKSCAVDVLGPAIQAKYPDWIGVNDNHNDGTASDTCLDVLPAGGGRDYDFVFKPDLLIPCVGE